MMGLVRAELRRVVSRRLFQFMAAVCMLAIVASAVLNLVESNRDLGAARAEAERAEAECLRFAGEVEGEGCPTSEEFMDEFDPRFAYAQDMPDTVRAVGVFGALLAFVVGASSFGADWGAGTVSTLLTWEPRRGRVLVAKLVSVVVVAGVAAFGLLALLSVVHVPAAVFRGDASGMTRGLWWTIAGAWLRGGVLASLTAAVGLGLVTVLRNTAGAVGIGFVYFSFGDVIVANIRGQRFLPWSLQRNVPWLLGFPGGEDGSGRVLIPAGSAVRPAMLIACYAALVVGAGYVALRSRDVT